MTDSVPGPHISDAELLAALDGELASADADRVTSHLEACWTCRSERDRVEAAIGDIVRYSRRRLTVLPPPSAAGRAKIIAHLHEHARQAGPVPWWRRPSVARRVGAAVWSAQPVRIVAIAASIALLVWPFVRTDTLSASELLTHARQAEFQSMERVQQPVVYQRVQIRTGRRTFIRTTYRDTTGNRLAERTETGKTQGPAASGVETDSSDVRRRLEAAGRDWAALLSATEYASWRSRIAVAKETVSQKRGTVDVMMRPSTGSIAESTLTLRVNDYHPIAEAIQMRDESRVEITELAHEVLTLSALQPSIFGPAPSERPTTAVASARPPRSPIPAEILDEAELDVRLALHETGADLAPATEVRRTPRRIEVHGQLPADTAAALRTRLSAISVGLTRIVSRESDETPAVGTSVVIGLQLWRTRTFGDAKAGEVELRETYALAERLRARTDAYHAIGRRYGDAAVSELQPPATEKLATLLRAYHAALVEDIDALDRKLAVVLGSTPRRLLESELSDTWRDQAAHASDAAAELLVELRGLVGRIDVPLVPEKDALLEPAEVAGVRRALTTLWTLFERRHANR